MRSREVPAQHREGKADAASESCSHSTEPFPEWPKPRQAKPLRAIPRRHQTKFCFSICGEDFIVRMW